MQSKTIQQLRPEISFLRITRTDQDKTRRMLNRNSFTFDFINPGDRNVEQQINQVVFEQVVDEVFPSAPPPAPSSGGGGDLQRQEGPGKGNKQAARQRASATGSSARPNTADVLSPPAVEKKSGEVRLDEHLKTTDRKDTSRSLGRRAQGAKAALVQHRGRYNRAVTFRSAGARIALDATLRALVGLKPGRESLTPVRSEALRYKLLKHKQGTLFVFAICSF